MQKIPKSESGEVRITSNTVALPKWLMTAALVVAFGVGGFMVESRITQSNLVLKIEVLESDLKSHVRTSGHDIANHRMDKLESDSRSQDMELKSLLKTMNDNQNKVLIVLSLLCDKQGVDCDI